MEQEYLETIIPSIGGQVMVLSGPWAGQSGKILEKSSEKELAIVQLDQDMEIQVRYSNN